MINNFNISTKEKIYLLKSLGLMIKSGVSLSESISSLKKDSSSRISKILNHLEASINQGNSISKSFEKFTNIFDKVTINIINSAEKSGTLDKTLIDISNDIQEESDFKNKVKSTLVYPTFVLLLSFVIFSIVIFYVIPKISSVFTRLNVTLPFTTNLLIDISEFLNMYYLPLSIFLTILILLLTFTYKFNKIFLLSLFYKLPVVSKLAIKLDLINITKNLNKLLKSGIPIDEALNLTLGVTNTAYSKKVLNKCIKDLEQGSTIYNSIKDDRYLFTGIYRKIIESGENSATLEESFLDIYELSKDDLESKLSDFINLLEPLLIVFLGLFVGLIIISIIGPIYQLISAVGN